MDITCPHCNFSKQIDPARAPQNPAKVSCPKCKRTFTFTPSQPVAQETGTAGASNVSEQVSCPACGLLQEKKDRCGGCGVIFAKIKEKQKSHSEDIMNGNLADLRRNALDKRPQDQPKAGFWIRVVSYLLDSVLLGVVQLVLSLLIGLAIGMMGIAAEGDPAINTVIWLFGVSLSISYAVFFIGYCGQTPGKMALRIKVIRTDGSPLTYGRAARREVLGKFISSILLGIGYLMVAFDSKKQGLHDKISDTYVIKL
jgi:predicted Zn finger-like uncharacterized protein